MSDAGPIDITQHAGILQDPERLRVLQEADLLDRPDDAPFDHLTSLAARFLDVPLAMVNLIDADRQISTSCVVPADWVGDREMALQDSFCRYVVATREPLVVDDAAADPVFRSTLWVQRFKVGSYLGAPIISPDGQALGSLCIADFVPRSWTEREVTALTDLASAVVTEIELRRDIRRREAIEVELQRAKQAEERARRRAETVLESITDAFVAIDFEGTFTYANRRAAQMLEASVEELIGGNLWERFPVLMDSSFAHPLFRALSKQSTVEFESFYVPRSAWLEVRAYPTAEGLAIYFRDITQRKQAQMLLLSQNRVLELLSAGAPLPEVLESLAHSMEEQRPDLLASIMVLEDGVRLRHGAAPSLPEPYWRAVDGMEIGPMAGACGTAVFRRQPVITSDIATDPLWKEFGDLALSHGLRSAWSVPIVEADGSASGAVCMYFTEPREPGGEDLRLIQNAAQVAGLAIQRWRAEEALRESEARFRQVVENIEEVFWLVAVDDTGPDSMQFVYVSPSYQRILGQPLGEFWDDPWAGMRLVTPETRPELEAAFRRALEGNAAEAEYEIVQQAGERLWLRSRMFPVRDQQGEVFRIAGLTEDTTTRRRAEEALRESEARFRQLAESIRAVFWMFEPEFARTLYVSPAYREIWGIPPDSLYENPRLFLEETLPEDQDRLREAMEAIHREERTVQFRIFRPDGELRWLESRGFPVRDEQGRTIRLVGIVEDITDRKNQEAALSQAKEEAERANRAKSDFLSRMSHELRTPLNAILGFGQLLEVDVEREEDRESVEQILRAGRHLLSLIDEVLDLARIEAGRLGLAMVPVEVATVVQESADLVRTLAAGREIRVTVTRDAPAHFVNADAQRLKQVMLNLLSNAIKYNQPGGSVVVRVERAGDEWVRITVRDTGPGIPSASLKRLFVPFERLDHHNQHVPGTGLGLALSRGLVEAMGGRMGVESTPGEGSSFWVELREVGHQQESALADPEGEESAAKAARRRILYVEDNVSNIRLMERILARRENLELIPAMQGSLGLELARQHPPDLILLDMQLPDLGGEEVLRRLREDHSLRDVPVVVISADATKQQISRVRQAGVAAYLTKPFDVREVLRVLDEALADDG